MYTKVLHVILREYTTRIKTKSFLISTIITPLFMVLIVTLPVIFSRSEKETQRVFVVKDDSGILFQNIKNSLNDTLSSGRPAFVCKSIDETPISFDSITTNLYRQFQTNRLDGLLHIDKDVFSNGRVVLYSQNVSDLSFNRRISSVLNSSIVNLRLTKEGLQPEIIHRLMRSANIEIIKVRKEGIQKERGQTFFLAFLLMMVLYITLTGYGMSIMRSVIEEKTSRIVEILISSLRPIQLMMGKILGVSLVGLTPYLIWVICGILLFTYGNSIIQLFPSLPRLPSFPSVPAMLFLYFILFFILGYLFYAALFAAVGAMAGEESDTQQLIFPIILPLIFPIVIMSYIQANPDSSNVVILSLIPFFTPLIMMVRVIATSPPLWQIISSILIMILAIILATYITARIYRIGILMYGKRPTFSEVIKWIRMR